jgi:hypothetical protein
LEEKLWLFNFKKTETGEGGPHLIAAPVDVGVEERKEPDFAMIPHPQMEEKIVQERQQKVRIATLNNAQVFLNKHLVR